MRSPSRLLVIGILAVLFGLVLSALPTLGDPVALVGASPPASSGGVAGAWVQAGYNASHDSRSPLPGPLSPGTLWTLTLGNGHTDPGTGLVQAPDGAVLVSVGFVANVTSTGHLAHSYYAPVPSGVPRSYARSRTLTSTPAVESGGLIVQGETFPFVAGFGSANSWVRHPGPAGSTGFDSSVSLSVTNQIYLQSASGAVFAFSPNGSYLWNFGGGVGGIAPAVAPRGLAYEPLVNGTLVGLTSIGQPTWWATLPSVGTSTPSLAPSGVIYIATGSNLTALNPNGTVAWSNPVGGIISTNVSVSSDGTAYVGVQRSSQQADVVAVAPNGTVAWTFDTGGALVSTPALDARGNLYVAASAGVFALHGDGTLLWSVPTLSAGRVAPIVGGNQTLFVVVGKDQVVALQAAASTFVTLVANGLPIGDFWNVTVNGVNYSTQALRLTLREQVGVPVHYDTSPIACGSGCRYAPANESGFIPHPSNTIVDLAFHPEYLIKIVALAGGHTIPSGDKWVNQNSSAKISAPAESPYGFLNWSSSTPFLTILNPSSASTAVTVYGPGTLYAHYN